MTHKPYYNEVEMIAAWREAALAQSDPGECERLNRLADQLERIKRLRGPFTTIRAYEVDLRTGVRKAARQ